MTFKEIVKKVGEVTTPTTEKSEKIIKNIRTKIKLYVEDNNLKSLVIGISGGLDSAVVATLCQEKYTGVPLIGLSIPLSSSQEHREQAEYIGSKYCSSFKELNIWDEKYFIDGEAEAFNRLTNNFQEFYDALSFSTNEFAREAGFNVESFPKNILEGNVKARIRMITLYDVARKTNGMVLSTDNLSEFQMGFWTICGDVGDYGPIQNIGKGFELTKIAETLGIRNDIIYQKPSDGLMVTEENTDEAQLGANYKEVDTILIVYLNTIKQNCNEEVYNKIIDSFSYIIDNNLDGAEKIKTIINRYKALEFKRKGTINLTREEISI